MYTFKFVPIPTDLLILGQFDHFEYADCYRSKLRRSQKPSVDALVRAFFSTAMPKPLRVMLALRKRLVARYGLKQSGWVAVSPDPGLPAVAVGDVLGSWHVVERGETEIIFRENDAPVDFAFSIRVREFQGHPCVEATTMVQYHGWFGRMYFAPVKFLHRRIVPWYLSRVVQAVQTE